MKKENRAFSTLALLGALGAIVTRSEIEELTKGFVLPRTGVDFRGCVAVLSCVLKSFDREREEYPQHAPRRSDSISAAVGCASHMFKFLEEFHMLVVARVGEFNPAAAAAAAAEVKCLGLVGKNIIRLRVRSLPQLRHLAKRSPAPRHMREQNALLSCRAILDANDYVCFFVFVLLLVQRVHTTGN